MTGCVFVGKATLEGLLADWEESDCFQPFQADPENVKIPRLEVLGTPSS